MGGAALAAVLLVGCAQEAPTIAADDARSMQRTVVAIGEQAAAGEMDAALVYLDDLQGQLDEAVADGDITAARASAVQDAIDAVRAGLTPTPTPTPTPETPAEEAPAVETPAETTSDSGGGADESGNENENAGPGENSGKEGKGEEKGKGEDKGKGKPEKPKP
jgi:hypothetical protein